MVEEQVYATLTDNEVGSRRISAPACVCVCTRHMGMDGWSRTL